MEIVLHKNILLHMFAYKFLTQTLLILQAAEKFKAPQPAPVIPEAKAAAIEQEEESEEEEVCDLISAGFVQVLENQESPGILQWHFPGLESPEKSLLVLESAGIILNSSEKYKMYGRQ